MTKGVGFRNLRAQAWADKHRRNKWAMCAYKGGRCVRCKERVTHTNMQDFHFDHRVQLNDALNSYERWNAAREWSPFSDKWFDWAETIDLICAPCHYNKHKETLQIALDLEVQSRLDKVQERFDNSPIIPEQTSIFEFV